jgi:hypothetical protein
MLSGYTTLLSTVPIGHLTFIQDGRSVSFDARRAAPVATKKPDFSALQPHSTINGLAGAFVQVVKWSVGTKWAGRARKQIDLAAVSDARNFRSPCSAIDLQLIAWQRFYISTASQDTQNRYIFIMTEDVSRPPAHRDKTAIHGAQLSMAHAILWG